MDTAYRIPAVNAPQRTFNAQPIQLKITARPTNNICGITSAVAMPAPRASAPSDDAIPPAKYEIKYTIYNVPRIAAANNSLLFFIVFSPSIY